MSLSVNHWVRINESVSRDNTPLLPGNAMLPEDVYRQLGCSYPKFFKMDMLCKWAWLSAEALLKNGDSFVYDGLDKTKIAVVLMTGNGCIDVDKKYLETVATIPSPALFVYTLPNIMLGEICIRHGFKGEQACMVSGSFDSNELFFWVNDLLLNRGMDACLCGWVDAVSGKHDTCLLWISKNKAGIPFSADTIQQLYKG